MRFPGTSGGRKERAYSRMRGFDYPTQSLTNALSGEAARDTVQFQESTRSCKGPFSLHYTYMLLPFCLRWTGPIPDQYPINCPLGCCQELCCTQRFFTVSAF